MTKIPEPTHVRTTADAILKSYEKEPQEHRPHLGASEIGNSCERAIWYNFRWCTKKEFEGRMLRLFNSGHREEKRFLEELKKIGVEIYEKDQETGDQINFKDFGGHFAGSCDGIGKGFSEAPKAWAVVEYKTHSDKSFSSLTKEAVQKSKPQHYAQMQVYMGKFELDRALYLACNKNTDEIYSEWVKFDKDFYQSLLVKAERIIFSITPPSKLSEDPNYFECRFCDHKKTCHDEIVPQKNCRTCASVTPMADGSWQCDLQKRTLTISDQKMGCRSHLYIPDLVAFAAASDYNDGYVMYEKGGKFFANATEEKKKLAEKENPSFAIYTSDELQNTGADVIFNEVIETAKIELKGKSKTERAWR